MKDKPEDLYLDLLKKTLAFALWPEPPTPLDAFNYLRPPLKRGIASAIFRILKPTAFRLVKQTNVSAEQRAEGNFWPWPQYADTMLGLKRLDHLQLCVETVIQEGIAGDLIETGVWRGGACILMRAILAAYHIQDRKVYVADSFEGLPKPEPDKFPADKNDRYHQHTFLAVSQETVENNFRKYGLLDDQVVFLKGWFKDTLPNAPLEKIAVLRLDGDMYSSTMKALTHLYPKLSIGGFCIIDDYSLSGCRHAVDDFRAAQSIQADLQIIDWTGRFWRKA